MTDLHNTHFGLDAQVNHRIAALRAVPGEGDLKDLASPLPDVFFSIDPEAELGGRFRNGGEDLIHLSYDVVKKPRWIGLHLAAGALDLTGSTVLGVVCKSQGREAATFRICLRSAAQDGFVDAFLPKTVVAFAQPSVHVDLLRLDATDAVPEQAAWREIVLFFQPDSADITLHDLRVFIV